MAWNERLPVGPAGVVREKSRKESETSAIVWLPAAKGQEKGQREKREQAAGTVPLHGRYQI